MNIAQVTPVYPPYRGGMGNVAFEYTTRLQKLGHTVEVFTPTMKFGNAGFLSLKDLYRLREFDVVHLHYPFYGAAEQITLLSLFQRLPLVLTYHMDATASGLKGLFFDLHRWCFQSFMLRRAKKVLVSSMDYADQSALRRFSDRSKIVALPFGVDTRRFCPAREDRHTGLPLRLLFVGGLDTPHIFKGLPVLLAALPMVKGDWTLTVVGDGDLRANFEAQARTKGLAGHIHFVGKVDFEALPEYYRQADIHVFPSTTSAEAFGLVSLEAAASGIPTIASNLPGVRTVVQDTQTGLLVPPNDPPLLAQTIKHLLSDPAERIKMGQAARKRVVEHYAWEEVIKKLVEIYENLYRH